MKFELFPEKNFDSESKDTIRKLITIAEALLEKLKIKLPESIKFYDELNLFIETILPQVENYGLTTKQSTEFIKASLNYGSYGTFSFKNNAIIEMNFNPYYKLFYPSIHFLKLLIHETLHLFLYSKLDRNIYNDKFKFENGQYIGEKRIIQLDEGFAKFLTDEILKDFDFDSIKELPVYSGLNEVPTYKNVVEGIDIKKISELFNKLYEKNSTIGYKLIKNKFNKLEHRALKIKILLLIDYIQQEIKKLGEHK